jgi:hypothetical protein
LNLRPLVPETSTRSICSWFARYLAAPERTQMYLIRQLFFPNLSQLSYLGSKRNGFGLGESRGWRALEDDFRPFSPSWIVAGMPQLNLFTALWSADLGTASKSLCGPLHARCCRHCRSSQACWVRVTLRPEPHYTRLDTLVCERNGHSSRWRPCDGYHVAE